MANISNVTLPLPLDSVLDVGASLVTSSRYSTIAVYAFCFYDWVLSIADEYELIWKAPLTTIKTAYIVCRYYPLLIFPLYLWFWLVDHSAEFCERAIHPLYGALVIYPLSAQAVILMRAYAFTGRNHVILCVLCVCYFALGGAETWLFGKWFALEKGVFLLFGDSGCYANDGASVELTFHFGSATASGIVMFAAFLMDVVMMGVVFMHCYRNHSFQGALGKFFVLQGFAAFVIMAALNLTSAVTYLQSQRQYDGVVFPFLLIVPDVLACRLILSLRRKVLPSETFILKQQSQLVGDALRALELQEINPPNKTENYLPGDLG